MERKCFLIPVLIIALTFQGCSSWFNPHVEPDDRPEFLSSTTLNAKYMGDLPAAIDYADKYRTVYYEAVGEQSKLRSGLATTLVSMGAAALGLGITGSGETTQTAIAALGLGGASLFGIGNLMVSQPRQRIWLAGSQAIGCTITAMTPYLMTKEAHDELVTNIKLIDTSIPNVERKIREVELLIEKVPENTKKLNDTKRIIDQSEIQIVLAKDVIKLARENSNSGHLLSSQIQKSGIQLVNAVHNIRDSVSAEILKTEPDMAAIAAMVGQLSQFRAHFAPTPSSGDGPEGPEAAGTETSKGDDSDPLADLKTQTKALVILTEELSKTVNTVVTVLSQINSQIQLAGDVNSCQLEDVDTGIQISPDVTTLELTAPSTQQIAVFGGTGVPRAVLTGTTTDKVTVDTKLNGGTHVVVIDVHKDAPAVELELTILDSTNSSKKVIRLTIKRDDSGASGDGDQKGKGEGDGKGNNGNGEGNGGNGENGAEIIDSAPEGAMNDYEKHSISEGDLKEFQGLLQIPDPSGKFDDITREKLKEFQAEKSLTADGQFNEKVVEELYKLIIP